MLSQNTIAIIKSTVPLLETHGQAITEQFYHDLFTNHPFLRNIFNMSNQTKGDQPRALADAVLAYAKHIDNIDILVPVVERIAHKHASLGVRPKHYDVVGETLLNAIQQVLNLPDGHDALTAWSQAYNVLAAIFIKAEAEIYQTHQYQQGGWQDYRDMYIADIQQETPEVKSFYLKPMDLEPLMSYHGGQYIGVKVHAKSQANSQIRQYSLSRYSTELDAYRISVKAEDQGSVSNYLHQCGVGDAVSIQAPTGVFTLASSKPKHVFIAGGIGITPLMSMLQDAIQRGISGDNLLLITCAKDTQHQVFNDEILALQQTHGIQVKHCLDHGNHADHQGYLTADKLQQWLGDKRFEPDHSHIYFCGPKPFMNAIKNHCLSIGFDENALHYEVFGPTTALA